MDVKKYNYKKNVCLIKKPLVKNVIHDIPKKCVLLKNH